MKPDPKRELLRHAVATIAFRGRIALEGAPDGFGTFRVTDDTRTPAEILAHIGDLLEGSRHLLSGKYVELASQPLDWNAEARRFFEAVKSFDAFLASDTPLAHPAEAMIQGPVGDALTHVGQIVMLRRIAGAPIRQEPYFTAKIVPGEF